MQIRSRPADWYCADNASCSFHSLQATVQDDLALCTGLSWAGSCSVLASSQNLRPRDSTFKPAFSCDPGLSLPQVPWHPASLHSSSVFPDYSSLSKMLLSYLAMATIPVYHMYPGEAFIWSSLCSDVISPDRPCLYTLWPLTYLFFFLFLLSMCVCVLANYSHRIYIHKDRKFGAHSCWYLNFL